jgi:hypothetical protein
VDLRGIKGAPATYSQRSGGSGKLVHIHFCAACGTKLHLSFERWPDICGVYAGTYDDPDWFDIRPENSKHIFLNVARHDTLIPPDISAYGEHAAGNDGTPREPTVFDKPHVIGRR